MADKPTQPGPTSGDASSEKGERLVYVMPGQSLRTDPGGEISLIDLWQTLWNGRWRLIAVTGLFALASVAYAVLATEWFRAEALLAPADEKNTSSLGGQLGGLGALAGVNVSAGSSMEAFATLKSRELARGFIEDHALLPVFFADEWDLETKNWRSNDPKDWPDIRDGVTYFHEKVLRVSQDRQTNFVTLAVEWTNPEIAAQWVAALVSRVNVKLRERALREAEVNVAYLQHELTATGIVALQQTIGRLLETEMQKLMLARGDEEYAFIIIDSADAPKEPVRPRRLLIVMIGTLIGGLVGTIYLLAITALPPRI